MPEVGKVHLARVHWAKGFQKTHWVIVDDEGKVIDPDNGIEPDWLDGVVFGDIVEHPYISSFYEVYDAPAG
jgi:hypothetical protein